MNWYIPQKFSIKIFKSNPPIMASTSGYLDLKSEILKLKGEFEERFSKNESSLAGEKLKSFKFLAILGQGAFGVVVSNFSNKLRK